jgi:beta-xylosidase
MILAAGIMALVSAQSLVSNPIIWADVPDPSVIRVGKSYYMSSTTMHMSPGLPIMKSEDLAHWKLIGYAYDRLGDSDELNLLNGKSAYSRGSWASSLQYHDGTYYVSTFSFTTGKTYIYTTRNIEKGEWKEHSFSPAFHDHSLVFDGGRTFLIYGAGEIRMVELNSDLSGPKQGGINQVIIADASKVAGPNINLRAEGSQLFKINGKYYLHHITWPRGGMRTQLIHRADQLEGPYVGRILLQDKGVAQGGFVDTPEGKWYAYLFQDHGAVGRIPYLVPIHWEDEWPVAGVDGRVPDILDIPSKPKMAGLAASVAGIVASDEFDAEKLRLAWQWNHNPVRESWSLTSRKGHLRLTTSRLDSKVTSARNTLTQRTFGPECAGEVLMDLSKMKDGDRSGLVALMNRYAWIGVRVDNGEKHIAMVSSDGSTESEVAAIPISSNKVHLRMECDFRNRTDLVQFAWSLDGRNWHPLGSSHRLQYDLVHFMGCRFGLFNYATQSTGGTVDFDYFRVSDRRVIGSE